MLDSIGGGGMFNCDFTERVVAGGGGDVVEASLPDVKSCKIN